LYVKLKRPWWQATTSLRQALIIGGGYLIAGLGALATGLLGGRIWLAVMNGLFCLSGTPWYITAIVLLKQRHRAATEKARI
jgi:hypothetical protein